MRPARLDHVALWITDRQAVAARVARLFEVRVLEEGDDFTLLGTDLQRGKLALYDAAGPREESQVMHVAFRAPGGEEWTDIEVSDPLHLLRLRADESTTTELDHVALRVPDPELSESRWSDLGFERTDPRVEFSVRLRLGETFLELYPGTPMPTEKPLLNHVALLVESIDPYVGGSAGVDFDILETKAGPGSRSLFVDGPDDVRVELLELEPSRSEEQAHAISSRAT